MKSISLKSQAGVSLTVLMFGLVVSIFVLLFTLKAVPYYIDDYYLQVMLEDLPEQVGKKAKTKDVKKIINKQLDFNNLDIPIDQLEVKRYKDTIDVIWPYERKVHFFSNIDLLFSFKQETSI